MEVQGLTAGGSAEMSGEVAVGDVIVSIDSELVLGLPLNEVRRRIIGQVGTVIKLGLQRKTTRAKQGPFDSEEAGRPVGLASGDIRPANQTPVSELSGDRVHDLVVVSLVRTDVRQASGASLSAVKQRKGGTRRSSAASTTGSEAAKSVSHADLDALRHPDLHFKLATAFPQPNYDEAGKAQADAVRERLRSDLHADIAFLLGCVLRLAKILPSVSLSSQTIPRAASTTSSRSATDVRVQVASDQQAQAQPQAWMLRLREFVEPMMIVAPGPQGLSTHGRIASAAKSQRSEQPPAVDSEFEAFRVDQDSHEHLNVEAEVCLSKLSAGLEELASRVDSVLKEHTLVNERSVTTNTAGGLSADAGLVQRLHTMEELHRVEVERMQEEHADELSRTRRGLEKMLGAVLDGKDGELKDAAQIRLEEVQRLVASVTGTVCWTLLSPQL
eukprot:2887866-Rhodomonas_salina.1